MPIALAGKYRFSLTTVAYFVLGLVFGILLGPYPEGIPYGHGDYGWAIWGGLFLFSIPVGLLIERAAKLSVTFSSKKGKWLILAVVASILLVVLIRFLG